MDESCKNCRFCFQFKELKDRKWAYSLCCAVYPVTEHDGFVIPVSADDVCEMYYEKVPND